MPVTRTPGLEIEYIERNLDAPDTIVLVHGFPDDARTWDALRSTQSAGERGATLPDATANRGTSFIAAYERVVVPGAGHFVQREDPQAVAHAIRAFRARLQGR